MGVEPKRKTDETRGQKNGLAIACNNLSANLQQAEVQRELFTEISLLFRKEEPLSAIIGLVLSTLRQYSGAHDAGIWLLSPNGVELIPIASNSCTLSGRRAKFVSEVRKRCL